MVLFENNFVIDSRDVSFEFEIPYFRHTYGYYPPSLQFWWQLSVCLSLHTIITCIFITMAWFLVVKNRNNAIGFLACFGFLLPTLLILPFYLIPYLGLQNTVLAAPFVGLSPANALHMIEIFYGTSPPFAEKNLLNFVLYHASPIALRFHSKTEAPVKGTRQEIIGKASKVVSSSIITTISVNWILQTDYHPFGKLEFVSVLQYFSWRHWGNNMMGAMLEASSMEAGTLVFGILITLLTGISTIEVNDSPFTKSNSIADFWGKRWNRQIGILLKHSVFRPCRQIGMSYFSSIFATFAMSSFLHEYIIYCGATAIQGESRVVYVPKHGRQTAFFMWNGVLLVLEVFVTRTRRFKSVWVPLPAVVKAMLVVMTSLPVGQWFMEDFIGIGFFRDFSIGFPKIERL